MENKTNSKPRRKPGPKKKEPVPSLFKRLYARYRNANKGMVFLYVFAFVVILRLVWNPVMDYFELGDDSIFEESIEYVIESQTGIEIDLSSDSE